MHVAICVEKDVVGLDVAVNNVLAVDVAEGTAQLCNPESNGLFCEGLSGDVESKVAAAHEVDHEVPGVGD